MKKGHGTYRYPSLGPFLYPPAPAPRGVSPSAGTTTGWPVLMGWIGAAMQPPLQDLAPGSAACDPLRPVRPWRDASTSRPPESLPPQIPEAAFLPNAERQQVDEYLWNVGRPSLPVEGAEVPTPIPTNGERHNTLVNLDEGPPMEFVQRGEIWQLPMPSSPLPEHGQQAQSAPNPFGGARRGVPHRFGALPT